MSGLNDSGVLSLIVTLIKLLSIIQYIKNPISNDSGEDDKKMKLEVKKKEITCRTKQGTLKNNKN